MKRFLVAILLVLYLVVNCSMAVAQSSESHTYLEEEYEIILIDSVEPSSKVSSYYNEHGKLYIVTEMIYVFYYENEYGILVQDCVTSDKMYSGFSRTLKEGEQPYLKKIHQYDVTVHKDDTITKEYRRTLNIFFVPENFSIGDRPA